MLLARFRLKHPTLITKRFINIFKNEYPNLDLSDKKVLDYYLRETMKHCKQAADRPTITIPNSNFANKYVSPALGFAAGVASCVFGHFELLLPVAMLSVAPIATLKSSYMFDEDVVLLSKEVRIKNKFFKGLQERKYKNLENVYEAINEAPTVVKDAEAVQTPKTNEL